MTAARIDSLRLVGDLGTNKVMAGELSRLVRRGLDRVRLPAPAKAGTGALVYPLGDPVSLEAGRAVAGLAVRYHRTASRVLWDLYASTARRLDPLYRDLARAIAADDRGWLRDGATFSVRARNVSGFAAGERQIVGAVKSAIVDGARARGGEVRVAREEPELPIAVRMHDGALTVSIDLAGHSMNQRGYRDRAGAAPVRETLAAALVMLCRHDPRREPLVDPMAGSGTIAIEAALMARGAPLWIPPRRPAADRIPGFADPCAGEALFADTEPAVLASDVDPDAVALAQRAANRAGAAGDLSIAQGDFRDLTPADVVRRLGRRAGRPVGDRGVILANPPYGRRLGGGELRELYRELGVWCRRFRGWRAGFLIANDAFLPAFGGRPRIEKPIRAGGLSARFCLYDL